MKSMVGSPTTHRPLERNLSNLSVDEYVSYGSSSSHDVLSPAHTFGRSPFPPKPEEKDP
jgi:hypothetical protein